MGFCFSCAVDPDEVSEKAFKRGYNLALEKASEIAANQEEFETPMQSFGKTTGQIIAAKILKLERK